MKNPPVTAHCLVKNEEKYIQYTITAVLPYVDKLIIFDTGSTDSTVKIINKVIKKSKYASKIHFEQRGQIDKQDHTKLRNEMIKLTNTEWFLILDGDEVWPKEQIKFLVEKDILASEVIGRYCILVSYHLCSIDLWHYTERGHFGKSWGLHGQHSVRVFKKINNIKWSGEYGSDKLFYYPKKQQVVNQANTYFSTCYYWHLSKLERSARDNRVFARKKPTRFKLMPNVLKKLFVKKVNSIPDIFYNDKII